MLRTFKISFLSILAFLLMFSCERYEDYISDHIPTVYFGAQKPLRTLVARDDDMQFKFGAVLAGIRENNNEEWVSFVIDPDLLTDTAIVGDNIFHLMPEEYYSLSDNEQMIIPAGQILGEIVVTVDHDLFTSDPDAIHNTYAFPLRITDTSADRILNGEDETPEKDYTIIVVKYISQYSGYYYRRGVQYTLDDAGNPTDTIVFTDMSLNKSDVWYLQTHDAHNVETVTTPHIDSSSPLNYLNIKIADNNAITIDSPIEDIAIDVNSASFDAENNAFLFDYFIEKEGVEYHVLDTLIQRQDPELDLRFEQW